jgi:hypothetical protein
VRKIYDSKRTLEIDGESFSTLEEFYEEVARKIVPGSNWDRSLSAFGDVLRSGFDTPDSGLILVWRSSELSRERLGYPRPSGNSKRGCNAAIRLTAASSKGNSPRRERLADQPPSIGWFASFGDTQRSSCGSNERRTAAEPAVADSSRTVGPSSRSHSQRAT